MSSIKTQPVDPEQFFVIFAPPFFRHLYRTHLGLSSENGNREEWIEGLIDILIDSSFLYYREGIPSTITEQEAIVGFDLLFRAFIRDKLSRLNETDVFALSRVESFEQKVNEVLFEQLPLKFPDNPLVEIIQKAWNLWRPRVAVLSPDLIASVKTIYAEYIDWLTKNPKAIEKVAWEVFEKLFAEIFASKGFHVELTGRMRNRSSDIIAIRTDEFGVETKYLIECKRWSGKRHVGLDVVNGVIGAAKRANVDHAFLVTSSVFSEDVIQLQKENHFCDIRLHLKDGSDIQEWLKGYTSRSDGGIWLAPGWDEK